MSLSFYSELSFGLRERSWFLGPCSYLLPCFVHTKSPVAAPHSIALAVLPLSRPAYCSRPASDVRQQPQQDERAALAAWVLRAQRRRVTCILMDQ